MVPVPFSMDIVKQLGGWIKTAVDRHDEFAKQKRADRDDAIQAMMNAVIETRTYLAAIKLHPEKRDDGIQKALSLKWTDAGLKMNRFSDSTASLYLLKADYWSDPQGWADDKKDDYIIELDRVFELGRKALLPKAKS
jgi:hypothetical protein